MKSQQLEESKKRRTKQEDGRILEPGVERHVAIVSQLPQCRVVRTRRATMPKSFGLLAERLDGPVEADHEARRRARVLVRSPNVLRLVSREGQRAQLYAYARRVSWESEHARVS